MIIAIIIIFSIKFTNKSDKEIAGKVIISCNLDNKEYTYEAEYNKDYQVINMGEDAYFTADPYCGYNFLYRKDLDPEERSYFTNKIDEINASLQKTFCLLKINIPLSSEDTIRIQNLMDAINVGLKDITDIEKKILEQGCFKPNEIFEKSFRTENGLKIDYQDDYTPKGR